MTQSFDANGNMLTQTDASGTTTYTWDARNRLVTINGPSVTATFAYDALGRRIQKAINGQTSRFHYDGLDIVRELGGGGDAAYLRTLAIDETLTRTDASGTFAYLADTLGSTVALADGDAGLITEYTYEPFGTTQASGSPSANHFQFTGRENDGTGLYYYRKRYYAPRNGRFLQEDPSRAEGLQAFYAYVRNRPVNSIDPLGLYSWGEFYQDWSQWADLLPAQEFWQGYSQEALNQGDWVAATAGDVMGGLLGMSGLPTVQESAETIGSIESTPAEKGWAAIKIGIVGASWYCLGTGKEIPLGGKRRAAPLGNRTGHPYGELPHYHRRITGPDGKTVPGGSDKWHRPWEKGF